MFKKILIANRGEIALRVIRACRELGIETVAVHSDIDAEAIHTRLADEAVCIGAAPASASYLHIPAIIAAAEITGADAIHPGYGFLAENPEFAATCEACKLTFIGPTSENLRQWGDKVRARSLARRLGLPVLEGSRSLRSIDAALQSAETIGYPVMLKATAGGGGRGMKVVRDAESLRSIFEQTAAESEAAFGGKNDLYMERFIEKPRHVEFQVLCDGKGEAFVLGDRDCSIQRRHQKILEEAPSSVLSPELRKNISTAIQHAMIETGYRSAGTLEFLMDEKGELAFIETNPRIQVEHTVTEMVTGIDIVREQIRVAAGEAFSIPHKELTPRGHAIECRINAEDPSTFAPCPGRIVEYHAPGGAGIRVDDGVYGGWTVPKEYDSLIAKIIAHGRNRQEAIARMRAALDETIVAGIQTNIPLQKKILAHPDFIAGDISTRFLDLTNL